MPVSIAAGSNYWMMNKEKAVKNKSSISFLAEREVLSPVITPNQQVYQNNVLRLRHSSYINYPAHVHLETFAQCNAACNFCPYPSLDRKGARMSDDLIEKIVCDLEDIPRSHLFQLSPFKVNEPFLDHRILDLLEMFQARLPNASITLTTNASPLTLKILNRLAAFPQIGYLWISFNDHRQVEYETTMQLPYRHTIEQLNLIHVEKSAGRFPPRVVLSRVGDLSTTDRDFVQWVKSTYPLFEVSIFSRGEWLGQVATNNNSFPPNIGCIRWFDLSITATGVVALCCMDGKAEYPIGDVGKKHLLEIYNQSDYRRLRADTSSRLKVEPCRRCHFL